MVRNIVGGLAGLGVIGGAGAVLHNDGSTTVKVTDPKTGQVRSTTIDTVKGGPTYHCSDEVNQRLDAGDEQAGRIKITITQVEGEIKSIERQYTPKNAPKKVAARHDALLARDKKLSKAFDKQVDLHNTILKSECKKQ